MNAVGGAGSPFSRMPSKTEGGLRPAHQPTRTECPHSAPFSDSAIGSRIFNAVWSMRKNGLRAATIKNILKALKFLAKHVDLSDPRLVKGFIAKLDGSEGV